MYSESNAVDIDTCLQANVVKTMHVRCNAGIMKMNLMGQFGDFQNQCGPTQMVLQPYCCCTLWVTIIGLPWIPNMTTQCTLQRMMGAEVLTSWKGSIHVHRQWHEWHKCLGAHQHCQLSRIVSKNTLKRNTAMLCWPGRCKILSCFPGAKYYHVSQGVQVHQNCGLKANHKLPSGMGWHIGSREDFWNQPQGPEGQDHAPIGNTSFGTNQRHATNQTSFLWTRLCFYLPSLMACALAQWKILTIGKSQW